MNVLGDVTGYNPSEYNTVNLYNNTGKLNTSATYTRLIANMRVTNSGIFNKPLIYGETSTDFIDGYPTFIATVTGTSGPAGGLVTIDYPNGFNRDNCVIISVSLYRTNLQWITEKIYGNLASDKIIVVTPTDDSTTFSRAIQVTLLKKRIK